MKNTSFKFASETIHPGEFLTLALPLPQVFSCAPLYMPIKLIHGKQQGPTLLLIAAMYGNELNGTEIIQRLLNIPALSKLKGTLIAIPVMNVHGLINRSRFLPEGIDLNRNFPGHVHGTNAERFANIFVNEILSRADYCVNLQSGPLNYYHLPIIHFYSEENNAVVELAKVFNAPIIAKNNAEPGSIQEVALQQQKIFLNYVAGEAMRLLVDTNLPWQRLMEIISGLGFLLALIMVFLIKNNNRDGKSVTIYLQKERPFSYYLATLVKNPQVWFIAIYSGIVYIPMILIGGAWGIPYLKSFGFSDGEAANVISLIWIGHAIGALSFGGISDKIERRKPVLMFAAVNNIVLILVMIMLPVQSIYFYSVIFLLLGFGTAGQTIAFSAIGEHVDFATKATAMGVNNMSVTLITSISPIIAAYFIHHAHQSSSTGLLSGDFFSSFMMIPILNTLAAAISIFLIKETYCKFQKDPIFLKVNYKSKVI